MQVGLGPGHIVLDGDPAPLPKTAQPPRHFWATVCKTVRPMLSVRCLSVCLSCPVHSCPVCLSVTLVYCGQTVGWIEVKLGMQVGLGPGHIVLGGDPVPLPQRGIPPFSAHICFGQMAAWIKMPLVMEIGLGPGDCVRWGPSPPPKFSAHVYYSYCDFVRTLHRHYWFVQVQVQVLVFYAFL